MVLTEKHKLERLDELNIALFVRRGRPGKEYWRALRYYKTFGEALNGSIKLLELDENNYDFVTQSVTRALEKCQSAISQFAKLLAENHGEVEYKFNENHKVTRLNERNIALFKKKGKKWMGYCYFSTYEKALKKAFTYLTIDRVTYRGDLAGILLELEECKAKIIQYYEDFKVRNAA